MKIEAETGGMLPQAKEQLEPPEAGRARKPSPLEPSEGVCPGRHLDFGLLTSRTVEESISVVLSHQVCGDLLQQP